MTVTKNSTLLDPYGGSGSSSTAFTTPATVTLAVAATSTDGLILKTDQTATAGAQKFSPALHFQGSGWKTTATAAAQIQNWFVEAVPVEDTTRPVNQLLFSGSSTAEGTAVPYLAIRRPNSTEGQLAVFANGGNSLVRGATDYANLGVGVYQWDVSPSGLRVLSAGLVTWSSSTTSIASPDTGLSRISAGVVGVGTGAAGSEGGTIRAANHNSSVATGSIGFITGAGGTVTQATSKATAVTLSKPCGAITLHTASIATNTSVSFVMTCTAVAAGDVMILNHISGGTINAYSLNAQCGAGVATINVRNLSAAALGEAITIQYVIVKAVTA